MIHVCKNPRGGGGFHLQMQKDKITKESFNISKQIWFILMHVLNEMRHASTQSYYH